MNVLEYNIKRKVFYPNFSVLYRELFNSNDLSSFVFATEFEDALKDALVGSVIELSFGGSESSSGKILCEDVFLSTDEYSDCVGDNLNYDFIIVSNDKQFHLIEECIEAIGVE